MNHSIEWMGDTGVIAEYRNYIRRWKLSFRVSMIRPNVLHNDRTEFCMTNPQIIFHLFHFLQRRTTKCFREMKELSALSTTNTD